MAQFGPEVAVFLRLAGLRIDEQAVMLAFNFIEPVAHGVQELVVGVDDGAVGGEFDDGLGAAEGLHGAEIVGGLQPVARIRPFDDEAGALLLFQHRGDDDIEHAGAEADGGGVRGGEAGQHLPLLRRVFVEHINIGADEGGGIELRQFTAQIGLCRAHHLRQRGVDVGDGQRGIGEHDVGM